MHELGITRRILEVALDRAAAAGAKQVTGLHFEIGPEADVTAESIEFYWPQVALATPAEGARLFFEPSDQPLAFHLLSIDVEGATEGTLSGG